MADQRLDVVYASRFGSTERLAGVLAKTIAQQGMASDTISVTDRPSFVPETPVILLTSIIWDRPIPAMRDWIDMHRPAILEHTIACGVVCGAAGVRDQGGMVYAGHLAKRIGNPDLERFALSGEIPERSRLKAWEWWALKVFATLMRKPQLFQITADLEKARDIGSSLRLPG